MEMTETLFFGGGVVVVELESFKSPVWKKTWGGGGGGVLVGRGPMTPSEHCKCILEQGAEPQMLTEGPG